MITANDIAGVFNDLGISLKAFRAMIVRLIVLDDYNKATASLANARAEHAAARADMAASEAALEAIVNEKRAAADSVVGGGA